MPTWLLWLAGIINVVCAPVSLHYAWKTRQHSRAVRALLTELEKRR